jgi:hypothetical protein
MIQLQRLKISDRVALGSLSQNGTELCKTLELPWKDNSNFISCIPVGEYEVVKRYSEKYGDHFHVLDVPERDMILIHSGNFATDTHGCILVGIAFGDINSDGIPDIISSRAALKHLNKVLPEKFLLKIID